MRANRGDSALTRREFATSVGVAMTGLVAHTSSHAAPLRPDAEIGRYNYVIGTQTFSPAYRFTRQTSLVETAQAILDMGSNILKITLGADYSRKYPGVSANPALRSLQDLVRDEPSFRQVLKMPFTHYILWTYPFSGMHWQTGLSSEAARAEYQELKEFVRYLLTAYNRSGKVFLLGHWEGDWYLHPNYNPSVVPTPKALEGMIAWLNNRQKAVEDAKRETPHEDIAVYHYTEVNLVAKAMKGGKALTNAVLPQTQVDYVSYSSYDSLSDREEKIHTDLSSALDYIEAHLPPKPGLAGKRVFIGEYGFPAEKYTPMKQMQLSRAVMETALEWGCPYALYWEVYNNEVENGKQRGFWLINDRGEKQLVYHLHARILQQAKMYVVDFRKAHGRLPSADEYRRSTLSLLQASAHTPMR
ncbi:MAG TPA: hypothetical protein VKU00_05100 [Chthonomonadaceae bacterium]|nr:hypothetical protein [Chthonomonadaceae bacterium]